MIREQGDDIRYGDWFIWYAPPPIPIRTMDWHYAHAGFDGPEDNRYGHAESLEACKAMIDEEDSDVSR